MSVPHKVLAFDTALSGCSVAVYDALAGENCAHETEPMVRGQAERLVPMIQEVLDRAGTAFSEIDVIVSTVGPGAFTGLRIGLSTAQALGLALGKPTIGLTTLEVLARQFFETGGAADYKKLVVLIETKRKDFYCQYFDSAGQPLSEPQALEADEILKEIAEPESCLFIGDALVRFQSLCGGDFRFLEGCELPDPRIMARMACEDFGTQERKKLEPLYLRDADVSVSKKILRVLES